MEDLDSRFSSAVQCYLNADVTDWRRPQWAHQAAHGIFNALYPLSNPERDALRGKMISMLSDWAIPRNALVISTIKKAPPTSACLR